MVIFHSFLYVYQRVPKLQRDLTDSSSKKNLLEAFRAARETFGPVVAVWALSRADTRHEKRDLSICCTTVVVIVSKLMAWLRDIYIYPISSNPIFGLGYRYPQIQGFLPHDVAAIIFLIILLFLVDIYI